MTDLPKPSAVATPPGAEEVGSVSPGGMDGIHPDGVGEYLYLMGQPTLKEFIRYVRSHAVEPPNAGDLSEAWHAAQKIVRRLEQDEPGVCDGPTIEKLGPEYKPLLIEFLKDPLVQNSFNTVPTEVAFVELNQLVVYQKHIDLTFVRQLKEKLGPSPTDEQIFRTCLPFDHPQPPVKWSRVHRDKFVFISPSNDLRILGPMQLSAKNIKDYPPPGDIVGVAGVAVGFGSNFLNAVYTENRLILNNGSHRAYALRELGITRVPCIIQHTSTRDELDVVGATEICDEPEYFLKHPRPSMLKDYFSPQLRMVMPVRKRLCQITVKFETDEFTTPAF
jgi:hypothetical protein